MLLIALVAAVLVAGCTSAGASPSAVASRPVTSAAPASSPSIRRSAVPSMSPPAASPAATAPATSVPATPVPTTTTGSPPSAEPAAPTTATWTKLRPDAGPGPRDDHTWTVDEAGEVAYLFGGRMGSTLYGDLWAYDLAADTWSTVPFTGGPTARFGHEAVWLRGGGLLIFAGQAGSNFFKDLWLFDPATGWRELPGGGDAPVARYGTCAVIGPDGRLWISHGFTEDGVRFADTRAYDFGSGTWSDETPDQQQLPVARCLHGCWVDAIGQLVLYAGQTTGVTAIGDLWVRTPDADQPAAWNRVEGDLPAPRNLYATAPWGAEQLVFGGRGNDGYLGDLWGISLLGQSAREVAVSGDAPPARSGATLIADPERNRLLLFGGKRESGTFEDLWQLILV